MKSTYLFDLDGTLTDSFEGITLCIQHALRTNGHPVPTQRELAWCIGPDLKESFRTLSGVQDAAGLEELRGIYHERFAAVGWSENCVYPDIPGLLAYLQNQGCRMFVCTSKPTIYARRIVEHFGLSGYFQAVHGAEAGGTRSRKGELMAWLLQQEGLAAADCIMVGDRCEDVLAAKENGVRSIGVLWGFGSRAELEAAGADEIVERADQITHAPSR